MKVKKIMLRCTKSAASFDISNGNRLSTCAVERIVPLAHSRRFSDEQDSRKNQPAVRIRVCFPHALLHTG
ncbi:hypothetical protein ABLW47_24095, partial [Salmonella enterica]|uniref:hypothetical protein n=1 Tax=Salmonella enterica TaxID=28901 RepID=UPI0032B4ADFC